MKANTLRAAFESGTTTVGTHAFLPDPAIIETIGHCGIFDYVEFLAEYNAFHLPELDTIVRTAELSGLGTMIKVDYETRRYIAQRAVGSGFDSVLFADPRTVEDVQFNVDSVRPDTPEHRGSYGASARRNVRPAYGGSAEYIQRVADTVVGIMVEKPEMVENLEKALAIDGVDFVQWGPADYAMSAGLQGPQHADEVAAAEARVMKICEQAKVPARVELHRVSDLKRYADQGVRHFSIGYDLSVLHAGLKELGEGVRDALGEYS